VISPRRLQVHETADAPFRELQRLLNAIPGVAIAGESLSKRPSFRLAVLNDETAFNQFIAAMEWVGIVLTAPAAAGGVSLSRKVVRGC